MTLLVERYRLAARQLPPGRLALLLASLVAVLAACGPGGTGPRY